MSRLLLLACLTGFVSLSLAAVRCGGGHSCVTSTASCQNGKCVCTNPFVKGDGTFNCYKKNTVAAELKNDPKLTNFNNETIQFPLPCRYLVTHVVQELKDQNRDVIGNCEFKIHAFNAKEKGKFFTHGFDIAVKINYDDGRKYEMSARHHGIARDGVYTFNKVGTMGAFRPDGPWGNDDIQYSDPANDIELKTYEDTENNQLVFEFKKCGLIVTHVPYDVKARRKQISIPGLSVAINCAMHPQWQSNDKVMALSPTMDGGTLFGDHLRGNLGEEESMFIRSLEQDFTQNQPYDDNGECHRANDQIQKCQGSVRLEAAFKACYWMMKEPRFVRCYDRSSSGRNILKLFHMCVEMVCTGGVSCSDIKSQIQQQGCSDVRDIKHLKYFMRGDFCP